MSQIFPNLRQLFLFYYCLTHPNLGDLLSFDILFIKQGALLKTTELERFYHLGESPVFPLPWLIKFALFQYLKVYLGFIPYL